MNNSQSADIDCKEIVALTNMSKCNRFLFDVLLDISYKTYGLHAWGSSCYLWRVISTTIACQIAHKYKNWKKCSYVIADTLLTKSMELKLSAKDWKGTISVAGLYHDEESVNGYSEIIYDSFTYDGFPIVHGTTTSMNLHKINPVSVEYTIRFLLRPVLPEALSICRDQGYEKIELRFWTNDYQKYENIMNSKVKHEKAYNHFEVWKATCNDYEIPA